MPMGAGVGCHRDRLTSAGQTPLYWPCMDKPWVVKKGASGGGQVETSASGQPSGAVRPP